MTSRNTQKNEMDSRVEALLLEGLAGKDIPLTVDFWRELRTEAAHILNRRKR
jgi:hypothetical protein